MLLPKEDELNQIEGLDIAGYMDPADEVGGDYYDVLQHNGRVRIGIGEAAFGAGTIRPGSAPLLHPGTHR